MMKVLVTGASGQLGRCLVDRLQANRTFEFTALGSAGLDIGDADQVDDRLKELCPDVIINAAAYTAVDRAESEPEQAMRVNAQGAENLAQAAARRDIALIHISTDYVFDGKGSRPYRETDETGPIGVYGQTKLAGELAISAICPRHIILRTAWVYSEYGNNFVKTMLRLAESRDELRVVEDQLGCPTYAGDLADAIVKICLSSPGVQDWGTYHYVGATECNWAEFARCVFAEARRLGILNKEIRVRGIPTSEYPTPAERPGYSVLDCHRIYEHFGVGLVPLEQSLPRVLQRLKHI